MSDLFLATANTPNTPQYPPQIGNPSFFFGEGTNDLQIGPNNDFTLVQDLAKTTQDVQKILLTEQGTNVLFPYYGTLLQSMVGEKMNPNIISGQVQDQITTALQMLYLLTQNDPNPAQVVQTLRTLTTQIQSETNIISTLTVVAASGQEITTGISVGNI
jgi:hypothetical protein